MNQIFEAREKFYQEFVTEGLDYTIGYLSAYAGVRKFLAEQSLTGESNKYHGAKRALEEMLDKQE
jgi:hypothetical protein